MQRLLNRASGLAMATAAIIVLPTQVVAQEDTAPAAADASFGDNVIVVTARNRAESIQDVPLAITAFDEEALERQSIQELDDVARFTPGFSFEDFSGGFAQPVIRGQAQTRATALESNVSAFFDGIYLPRSWAVDLGTTNLERIEVVKGPQSARYGRNAFSGAINYLPKKAKLGGDATGEIEATVGSDERFDAGGFVNVPMGDRFAVAGSYNYSTYDGSWENSHPFADLDLDQGTNGNVGGWDNTSLSFSAIAEPADGIIIQASYNFFNVKNEARASNYLGEVIGDFNCGTIRSVFGSDPAPTLICGDLPAPEETVVNDPRGYGSYAKTGILRVSADIELTDSLDFTYIYGNVDGNVDIATSGEPDPINCGTLVAGLCNFQNAPIGDIKYETHEARLTFDNGGSIRGAIGGFISTGEDNFRFNSVSLSPITDADDFVNFDDFATPESGFLSTDDVFYLTLTNEQNLSDVISIFGELQWTSLSGATRVAAEGRYSETEITTTNFRSGETFNETFKEFAPRLTVEQDFGVASLLYATVARGTKAGGFNGTAIDPDNQVFGPEYNWTYEIGTKNTFADGKLILNASIFYTDWTDIQINSPDPDAADPNAVNITLNLGNAEIYGIELGAKYQATDYLSFDVTFSHNEATYSDGTVDARYSRDIGNGTICDDIVCNSDGDIGGNEIERTPPTQASFAAQWDAPIGDNGSYFLRGDVSWQSDFFADSANTGVIPSRLLVNARAGVSLGDVDVSIWARNLFDKKYVSNAFVVLLPFGSTYGEFFGERRAFGLTTKFNF